MSVNPPGQIAYDLRSPDVDPEEEEFQRIADSIAPGEIIGELEPEDVETILISVDYLRRGYGVYGMSVDTLGLIRRTIEAFDKAEERAIRQRMTDARKMAQEYAAEAAATAIYDE